jgi:5-(carboxyamino)imidazole ribonucleotide mutase
LHEFHFFIFLEVNMGKIGVIMGSKSDWEVMKEACAFLEMMGVQYTHDIVSAHRTPDYLYQYAKDAKRQGFDVIIAGAGGSAHLPGMVAALTTLPVIGVPIKTSKLDGLDSLLSIVQMPNGVPVGTMAINGSKNAALYAMRILGINDPIIAEKLQQFAEQERDTVMQSKRDLSL